VTKIVKVRGFSILENDETKYPVVNLLGGFYLKSQEEICTEHFGDPTPPMV